MPRASPPFEPPGEQAIVHCAHHRVGTVWFLRVLSAIAEQYGLTFVEHDEGLPVAGGDVVLYRHAGQFDRSAFGSRPIRGTHLIRDPRDVAVSRYHYHLWTDEAWAHAPREEFGGRSHQEELKRLDPEQGLLLEIAVMARTDLHDMLAWDYENSDFLELRYEDLVRDEQGGFTGAFRHYGLGERATRFGLRAVEEASFRTVTGRALGEVGSGSHLRSGRPGEWREHFTDSHVARMEEVAPGALRKLGYD